jgi:hypothetical protein|tara:strand:+ start:262 stop:375 length:114 start_codon:yes stop_codon:yes gene_type:complete
MIDNCGENALAVYTPASCNQIGVDRNLRLFKKYFNIK